MSKRSATGKVISTLGYECLPVSRSQLRELWDFDNQVGSEIMGAPLRICSCKENDIDMHDNDTGIPNPELEDLKAAIKGMWIKAGTLFEVFTDPKHPELGYRLRVKESMPIKITLKEGDSLFLGWCARAPETGSCAHLYERSPVKPCGYMGGPASLCNWAVDKEATIVLFRPTGRQTRFLVRLECHNLTKGQELLWNYGFNKHMPVEATWFRECCGVSKVASGSNRQEKKKELSTFMFHESCVLCGEPFSAKNKESRVQRKPHFINSHSDYLGSEWNGMGPYMQEQVSATSVLAKADILNSLIQTLTKDLKWSVLPACKVMSESEQGQYDDPEALLSEFRQRCALLKAAGTLVLRGTEMADKIMDLSIEHLKPIPASVWRTLNWENETQPRFGIYSAPDKNSTEHTTELQSVIVKLCFDLI